MIYQKTSVFQTYLKPPEKPLSKGVVVFGLVAKKRGVDDQDLVVEAQFLDVHLEPETPLMFHGKGWSAFWSKTSISKSIPAQKG